MLIWPSAHALASPVRLERSASILLPSHLLLSLHLKPHPETQEPWLLPLSISAPRVPKNHGPPIRFLASMHNTAYLTRKKAHWRPAIERRFTTLLGTTALEKLVWREDMPDLILKLLRDRAVEKLSWYFKWRGRLALAKSPLPSHLEAIDNVSCVLFYGSLKTRAHELQQEAEEIVADIDKWVIYFRTNFGSYVDPHKSMASVSGGKTAGYKTPSWYEPLVPRLTSRALFPPLEYSTTIWRGRKVPLYSLTDMLGEEKALQLLEMRGDEEAIEKRGCWVMKCGRHNVSVELLLLQLNSYLATPGPVWHP